MGYIIPTHIQIRYEVKDWRDAKRRVARLQSAPLQIRYEVKDWRDAYRFFLDEAYKHNPDKFDSTFNSMMPSERKQSLGIYLDSEEEEMQHLQDIDKIKGKGKAPTPIADSNFYVYASKLGSKGGHVEVQNRLVEVRDRCRKVQDLLGWPKGSVHVQAFSEDQLLWPDD